MNTQQVAFLFLAIVLSASGLAATVPPAASPATPPPSNPSGPAPASVPSDNPAVSSPKPDSFLDNPAAGHDSFMPAVGPNQPKTQMESPQFFLPFMPLSLQQIQQQQQLMEQIQNKQRDSTDKLPHQFWVHPDGSVFRPAPGDISADSSDGKSKQLSRRLAPGYGGVGPYGGHYPPYPPHPDVDVDLRLRLGLGVHL